jgi:eukaryotic-like serine/threonine-protein kinase
VSSPVRDGGTPMSPGPLSPRAGLISGVPQLEKYELLEEIGHGGMATVYRARDPRLGREVAVKVIHKHLRENAEVGARFVAEARAAAKLRHPGIVDVFDVSGEDDPERYLVVELIRGCTLRKILLGHREMPAEVGVSVVLSLCEALEHAHASAIIHRDIKPENVLVELPEHRAAYEAERAALEAGPPSAPEPPVDEPPGAAHNEVASGPAPRPSNDVARRFVEGGPDEEVALSDTIPDTASSTSSQVPSDTQHSPRDAVRPHARQARARRPAQKPARPKDKGVVIKITDFGIAKILDAQSVTSTGQVLGSPAHMAPEQIEGGEIDPRTDVFALGVLMYECLVGHLPFEGKNPAQVLHRVLEGSYPAADRERPAVGGRWARIVADALARDPTARTPSAGQLGEQIRAELAALGLMDPPAEIAAYFTDPPGYAAALVKRLVPRVVARGEAARKAGDVTGAAADYNRALALCPDDLALLKRMGSLSSSTRRRLLVRRLGAILAGSATLGIAAFGIARALHAHTGSGSDAGVAGSGTATAPRETEGIASATIGPPAVSVSGGVGPELPVHHPRVPAVPTVNVTPGPASAAALAAVAAPSARKVQFHISPLGGKLAVDGASRTWFASTILLPVGPHQAEVTIDDQCCKRLSRPFTVEPPPASNPDDPQQVFLAMEIVPATVSLGAAPAGGEVTCPDLGLSATPGAPRQVKLREADWKGPCTFRQPDRAPRTSSVALKAGQTNVIAWPKD